MKEININYDLLRIIDTLSVMLLHIATATMWTNYENTFNWYVVNSYVTILHWVVPCFVMISGMIFLNPNKKISIKTLYNVNQDLNNFKILKISNSFYLKLNI